MRKVWIFLIILGVFIYFISPFDLIPDFFGLFGRLDDFSLLGWLIWFVRRQLLKQKIGQYSKYKQENNNNQNANQRETHKEQSGNQYKRTNEKRDNQNSYKEKNRAENRTENDPYVILNVKRNATTDEIKKAYKELTKKYHPDKVAHLGDEFQQIAHKKMINIQNAYEKLVKR